MRKMMMVVLTILMVVPIIAEQKSEVPSYFAGRYWLSQSSDNAGKTWKSVSGLWFDISGRTIQSSVPEFSGTLTYINLEAEDDGTPSLGLHSDNMNNDYIWFVRVSQTIPNGMFIFVYQVLPGKDEQKFKWIEISRIVAYIVR